MCNPYLLFSALIAAGMDGVDRGLTPPEPRSEDIFALTDEERDRLGIRTLPTTLEEALNCLEQDSLIRDTLGSQLCEEYIRIKRDEWREYVSGTVTDWEWEKYSTL
jgi:glutamine synthetase